MIRRGLVVLLLLWCGACGHGTKGTTAPPTTPAAPNETAETALRRLLLQVTRGQYGPAWDMLVPSQQQVVSRDRYITCQGQFLRGAQVQLDKVVQTYDETVHVPGTNESLPSTALTVMVTAAQGTVKQSATLTLHEFAIEGEWRWSLDQAQMDAFRAGGCA